jgi:hypothetical protein
MAQSIDLFFPAAMGNAAKVKIFAGRLNNTAAETSINVTAASLGFHHILALIAVNETATEAVRHTPVRDSATGLITQVGLVWATGGSELTLLAIGI